MVPTGGGSRRECEGLTSADRERAGEMFETCCDTSDERLRVDGGDVAGDAEQVDARRSSWLCDFPLRDVEGAASPISPDLTLPPSLRL